MLTTQNGEQTTIQHGDVIGFDTNTKSLYFERTGQRLRRAGHPIIPIPNNLSYVDCLETARTIAEAAGQDIFESATKSPGIYEFKL